MIDHKRFIKNSQPSTSRIKKVMLSSVSSDRLSREADQTQSCLAVVYLDGCSRGSSDNYRGNRKAG